tara:strand:+ start:13652 stop:16963 length:3312 start_codon:yes stop_codon:yes gene_type:complete
MTTNAGRIDSALDLLNTALIPYVEERLGDALGDWTSRARLPNSFNQHDGLDAYGALYALIHNWRDVFGSILPMAARDAASAALAGRNASAHRTGQLDDKVTLRALSGTAELLELIDAGDKAKTANSLYQQMIASLAPTPKSGGAGEANAEKPKAPQLTLTMQSAPKKQERQPDLLASADAGDVGNLDPWRRVMPPREDVLSGRLNKDSFAANLAVADRDYRAAKDSVYADPRAFFEGTHLTRGLAKVMADAGKRFVGGDAPSTIGLQTNFGGGKTHTLLSLLHMANYRDLSQYDVLAPVREAVGTSQLGNVSTAVFSGVDKGPDQPLEIVHGDAIRTLWGYIGWHLGGDEGLRLVEESERAGTNPGAEVLQKVLELGGTPKLVLLDELVVYIRQLSGERFEAHLSFLQSLTEAAAQVPNALIVGSLPESEVEAGQEQGREALRRLEKLFGRVQSAWEPAQGTETYAVVRRRLFQDISDEGKRSRKKTVDAFRKMYRDHKGDFPAGWDAVEYGERMADAYPVHPYLFDLLASGWSGLEKFQRTRGVLALLARALYAAYHSGTSEPLILPGSILMDDPAVKGALTEPLPAGPWSSIIDSEVDGDRALTWDMENRRTRYGERHVARRAARTVFLATAPTGSARTGINGQHLRGGTATPGGQISIFGDALRELSEKSAHLYFSDNRYWYGPQPTLNRVVEQREADVDTTAADEKIVELLKQERRGGGWGRIHTAPTRAYEASDERTSALVILGPNFPHLNEDSPALAEARDAVDRRSGGQRRFRNALLFLAADERAIDECRRLARRAIAWEKVRSDASLDLTESQRADAEQSAASAADALQRQIRKSWVHLLVPSVDPNDASKVQVESIMRRQEGGKSPAEQAYELAIREAVLAEKLGGRTLSEKILSLWGTDVESLPVDQVGDWYFEHLHMHRVRDETVVANAVSDAAATLEDPPFALATTDGNEAFRDIAISRSVSVRFGAGMVLLRTERAQELIAANRPSEETETDSNAGPAGGEPAVEGGSTAAGAVTKKSFSAVVRVGPNTGALTVNQIFENVITELERDPNAAIEITVEISATSPEGFSEDVQDIVTDNAKTLKFDAANFR